MIATHSATDLIIGFLGLYMVAAAAGLLAREQNAARIMDELTARPGLRYVTGVFVFTVGALIVSVHNLWSTPLEILASLFGWLALAEGIVLIVAGRSFLGRLALILRHPVLVRVYMAGVLVLGLALLVVGFG
ncbi:hypothetical protein [Roseovarius salinarum]|uniref:hypothetical protein n=1 Tax=Roseovarius salinarum TaxID=1981892 RepID=UPI000C32196A|nr:hypothetical protein [Roseovarius salinarum]